MTIKEEDEKEFEEILPKLAKKARQFHDEQGDVPTAFAFQFGAKWGWDEGRRTLKEKEGKK